MPASKAEIRQDRLAARDAIGTDERAAKSRAICDHGHKITFSPGQVISAYMPIRSEADIRPLMLDLDTRGARVCLPAVIDRQTIVFRAFHPEAELVSTGFGTSGPGQDQAVLDPDILLMPLSAFDARGNRIGYGAGHYDRAIARLREKGRLPRLIGIAFDVQRVENVPAEPHDVPLDAVLTESGLRIFR